MNQNCRWFVEALRDACNHALEDGMIGDQMGHIESIEVTDAGFWPADLTTDVKALEDVRPIELRVTCWGAYSPTECRRVYEDQGIIQVMTLVAQYLADRAVGLKESFDDLR
jgi:hypothetical protein